MKPLIKKLGTIDCDIVETTPIVFKERLYRFEYIRSGEIGYKPNKTGHSYFRFIDVASGKPTASFAVNYHLGSAYVDSNTVYVYGVEAWGSSSIYVFWSKDLNAWSSRKALDLPGWTIFNTSVCKGEKAYIMAFEIGGPPEEAGVGFTNRFAESSDLLNWKRTPSECVYAKDRYTACPTIRFYNGYYYVIYLELIKPGPQYESYIVRSSDLIHWESSPLNPVLKFSPNDKIIANPNLSVEQKEDIARATNINNSDLDLCEFKGKVTIYYSWGNQQGMEFLAEAVYGGTLADFLSGFFPD